MPLPLMLTPLPMIQPYINLHPSSSSLPLMLVLNLVLLRLQLLTQICREFPSGKLVIQLNLTPPRHSFSLFLYLILLPTIQSSLMIAKFHLLILSTFWVFKYPLAYLGGTILSKLLNQPQKNLGFSFGVNNILILLTYWNCILVLFTPAWNIALISGVLLLILLFSIGLNQRLSA